MNDSNTPESTEDQLPHEVVAAIRRQSGPPLNVSQTVENAILSDAAAHLSGIRKPNIKAKERQHFRWVAWSTGTIAAALLLFALLPQTIKEPASRSSPMALNDTSSMGEMEQTFLSSDVDQDGQVDILDAFALARSVKSGSSLANQWDQNGDGSTDQTDINLIAMNAVML